MTDNSNTETSKGWADIRASLKAESVNSEGEGYRVDIPANWKQGRTAYGG